MAKQLDEGMAHAIKGLSFFDWDGLDNDEYDKLSSIINTPTKSSGVELLFEDEELNESNDDEKAEEEEERVVEDGKDCLVGKEEEVQEDKVALKEAEVAVAVQEEEQVPEVVDEEEKEDIPLCEHNEEEKRIPECEGKEEKVVVDIENSVLQPSAPVFQPSIPPPSIMPFPIAVPHWTPHHPHHADPNMPHPAHQHPHHHHQPQTGPYSYTAVPGGYVFHPHDPSLAAAAHHHPHGHNGEPTTVPCFVTLSNGHQPHQSVYAYPGHHHIPAHYPYQSNTLAAASGLPSPLPHAASAAAAHHHHRRHHHHHHHIPSPTDMLHSMSGSAVIPTTPSHHHPMGYHPPHIVTTAVGPGQQAIPTHMVPANTMSLQQPHAAMHQHQQHLNHQPPPPHHQQHPTQFVYMPQEQPQQQAQSEPITSHAAEEVGGGDASVCANNTNNNERDSETIPILPQSDKVEVQPQNCEDSDNQANAVPEEVKEKDSPVKFTLSEIEFGGPVVFDTEPQHTANNSILEKATPTKSPASAKSRTKKSLSPSSPLSVPRQMTKSTPSPPSKKDKSSTSSKHKHKSNVPVTDNCSNSISQSQNETVAELVNNDNKTNRESSININHSSNVNASMPSRNVNNELPLSNKVTSPISSSSTSQPISSIKSSSPVNKKNPPSSDVNLLPSVNSSVAKEELKSPEAINSPKSLSGDDSEKEKSGKDSNKKPQPPVAAIAPVPALASNTPKSWSSLFGKQAPNTPSPVSPSTPVSQQPPLVNSVDSPQSSNSTVSAQVTSVRHWQEQEKHKGKEKSIQLSPSSTDNIKAVGVRQDPLAPKLLAKLSNFPISYIPIIVQPRGLKNGRNICFMNATLQVLMGCPPFIHLFRAFRNLPARSGGNSSTPVFDSLVQFVNSFQHCQRTKQQGPVKKGSGYAINVGVPFIPESLLGVAQHILGLNIGVQHDAEEFLSQILSICNEEVERIIKMNHMDSLNNNSAAMVGKTVMGNGNHHQNGDINNHLDDGNEDDGDGSWVQVKSKNYCVETNVNNCGQTPLSAIFAGLSRSTLVRDSGKTSDTVDSFFTLKLDIQADSVHSVRDALVRLNATEDVHDVDGTKVKGHRRMFFDELPPVLIMHLKLFKYSNGIGQKIQKNISFDVHLQIPKEMMSRIGKSKYHPLKSRSYKLFGVVNHHGIKMDDGHYTSDVFLPIVNGWLHFDDTKVSATEEATVLKHVDKSMPYLLFYRRVDV